MATILESTGPNCHRFDRIVFLVFGKLYLNLNVRTAGNVSSNLSRTLRVSFRSGELKKQYTNYIYVYIIHINGLCDYIHFRLIHIV